jgi:GNAT superfamily N-acetyltransferase
VRPCTGADLPPLLLALEAGGRPGDPEQLERYLAEQDAGLRVVLLGTLHDAPAGYLTLLWDAEYPPFRAAGVPEVQDLLVAAALRRRGVATALLDEAEAIAARRAPGIGLSVGVYEAYGPAQRLYARRGYLPDGRGATYRHRPLLGGEEVRVDDYLALHLIRPLRADADHDGQRP